MQRLLATLVGGGLALATLVLSADKPWLIFPTHGIVVGVALFLSRTSTAPYAFLLLAVTFVLVLRVYPLRLDASLPRLLAIAALARARRCAPAHSSMRRRRIRPSRHSSSSSASTSRVRPTRARPSHLRSTPSSTRWMLSPSSASSRTSTGACSTP